MHSLRGPPLGAADELPRPDPADTMAETGLTMLPNEKNTGFPEVSTCEITSLGQVEERVIEETTPFELAIPADGLDCLVWAQRPLSVEMLGPHGTRSQTRTSGGTVRIMLR